MATLDEKRDIILGIMNKTDDQMTTQDLSGVVRLIVGIMWPLPDAPPASSETTPVVPTTPPLPASSLEAAIAAATTEAPAPETPSAVLADPPVAEPAPAKTSAVS